ncbi:MAG: preprotein translocase subunit SecG [Clostridia bacterium]
MQVASIIVSIVLFVICIVLTCIVLMQEGKSAGLSGAISGAAETYFERTRRARWKENLSAGRRFWLSSISCLPLSCI